MRDDKKVMGISHGIAPSNEKGSQREDDLKPNRTEPVITENNTEVNEAPKTIHLLPPHQVADDPKRGGKMSNKSEERKNTELQPEGASVLNTDPENGRLL